MTNGDAGVPVDVAKTTEKRDLGKEFDQAARVGRIVLGVAQERSERPSFSVKQYTFPLLDFRTFPQEATTTILVRKDEITDEDVVAAQKASVVLSIEAAFQITEAMPLSRQTSESLESLEQVARMLNIANGLVIQTKETEPQTIIQATREAFQRRDEIANSKLNDQELLTETEITFQQACRRLSRMVEAVEGYLSIR